MVATLLILILLALIAGGMGYLRSGLMGSLQTTAQFLPMLASLMLVFGFSIVVAKHYETYLFEMVSGKFGLAGVFFAALLSPTSSGFAKFVEALWTDPQARISLLYLLTAAPLVSINLFFIRQIGLGAEIALVMYKVNFVIAIGLLPLFWAWGKIT